VDAGGTVLYDSEADAGQWKIIGPEEIREAFETGFGESERGPQLLGKRPYTVPSGLTTVRSSACRSPNTRCPGSSLKWCRYFARAGVGADSVCPACQRLSKRIMEPLNKLNLDKP
jgi:hypothetical protein